MKFLNTFTDIHAQGTMPRFGQNKQNVKLATKPVSTTNQVPDSSATNA